MMGLYRLNLFGSDWRQLTESFEHGKEETCGFHTMWVISTLPEQLLASRRIISSVELVSS
jgi:hypothetical protein